MARSERFACSITTDMAARRAPWMITTANVAMNTARTARLSFVSILLCRRCSGVVADLVIDPLGLEVIPEPDHVFVDELMLLRSSHLSVITSSNQGFLRPSATKTRASRGDRARRDYPASG